jgi:heme oxygenase
MNLKELTWDNHKKAERKEFASILMSGNIDQFLYYKYLTNQYYMYVMLEESLRICGFPKEYWSVFRAERMREDMQEIEEENGFVYDPNILCRCTSMYVTHVENLQKKGDLDSLIAHMYVRHFGDMYGGAMIAKKVPGSGRMYQFDNKEELKETLRGLLNDDMATEANYCFEYAIMLFEELCNGKQ